MDKLKQWVAFTALGALVILAAGWVLLISPKRGEASNLATQATQAQTANAALRTRLALLKAQAKGLPAEQAKLARVAAKIPDNPALPALIRGLDAAAAATDVELVSLSPSIPAPYAAGPLSATAPVVAGAPAAAAAPALQQISLNLSVVGSYFQVEQFLDRLEQLPRSFKVTGLGLAPGENPLKTKSGTVVMTGAPGGSLTATITGQVFLVPAAAAVPPTVPVAPAAVVPAK